MIPTPVSKLSSEIPRSIQNSNIHPVDLDMLFNTRRILSLRWAPTGNHIYFETNISGRFNIWRTPADGGWPEQLTVSDEMNLLEDPSPNGRYVLFGQDEQGDEKTNLYLFDSQNGQVRNVTNTRKIAHRDPKWTRDSRHIFLAAEREKPGAYAIYELNIDTGNLEKTVSNETGQCGLLHFNPDGKKLAFTRTWNYQHTGINVYDIETHHETVVLPIDDKSTNIVTGWTYDGRKIFVTSNANDQGIDAVGLLDPKKSSSIEWLTLGDWESFHVDTSPIDDSYLYVRNIAGNHHVYLKSLTGPEKELPLPPGVLRMARFSPRGDRIAMLHASADSPAEIWIYTIDNGMLSKITQSFVGGLESKNFVRPQLVVYKSFDDTPISAFLYMPPNLQANGSHPAIVYPHGGPIWQHMNDWYPRLQYFVLNGFIVIAPNYRGSTGYGRTYIESLRHDCGGGDLRDLVSAVEFLKHTGYVDPDAISIMGGSWGGYLTLAGLTKYPELWASGVAMVPMANWFTAHANEDPVLQANDEWLMGDPVKDKQLWYDRSPYFFADQIQAPLLLLAGRNDIRCPAIETEQMAKAARENGVPVDVHIYENEGHGFMRRENDVDAIKRAAAFLKAHHRKAETAKQEVPA